MPNDGASLRAANTASVAAAHEPLWSFDALARLSRHDEAGVRKWALRRLALHHLGESRALAVARIADRDAGVRSAALSILRLRPEASAAPALRSLAARANLDPGDRTKALSTLARTGAADSRELARLAEGLLPQARARIFANLADPDAARDALRCLIDRGAPGEDISPYLLFADIAQPSDAAYLVSTLPGHVDGATEALLARAGAEDLLFDREEIKRKELGITLDGIAERFRVARMDVFPAAVVNPISTAISARRFGAAVAHAAGGLPASALPASTPFAALEAWGLALLGALADLRAPTERHASMALALRLSIARRAYVHAAVVFARAPVADCLSVACALSEGDARALLRGAADRLAAADSVEQQRALAALGKALGDAHAPLWGPFIEFAARLSAPGIVRTVLDAQDADHGPPNDGDNHALLDLLASHRDELYSHAPAVLERDPNSWRATIVLQALEESPHRVASRIVLDHVPVLLASGRGLDVWTTLRAQGDPAALELALLEFRPGERAIVEAAVHLAQVSGRTDALTPSVKDAYEAAARRRAEARDQMDRLRQGGDATLMEIAAELSLELSLRCTRCGRTYTYDVERAVVDPDAATGKGRKEWDGVTLLRIIECKHCGAEDEYTLTPTAQSTLMMHSMATRGIAAKRYDDISEVEGRVIAGRLQLYDGTLVRRAGEGLRHLRALVDERPDDAEAQRRLGNLAHKLGRDEEAEAAWRKAVALDEKETEAAHSLAERLWETERQSEALQFAMLTIIGLPGCKSKPDLRQGMAASALDMLRAFVEGEPDGEAPTALMLSWHEGKRLLREPVINVSSVDLRKVRDWDALAELLVSDRALSAGFTRELPDGPTRLEALVSGGGGGGEEPMRLAPSWRAPQRPFVHEKAPVGRNAPCPCGSGKKHKKCCGA